MKVATIIAAGGKGRRFQKPGGKQYFLLSGKPVLYYTIKAFANCKDVDFILPVVNRDEADRFLEVVQMLESGRDKLLKPAYAGSERFFSVLNGLEALKDELGREFEESIVLVHDGARPFVSENLIVRTILKAKEKGACVPVLPSPDTLKEVDEKGKVLSTLSRERIRLVQTPQAFKGRIIYESYARFKEGPGIKEFTDDSSVVEKAGYTVYSVQGEKANIKITYPEDELFAEFYLKLKEEEF